MGLGVNGATGDYRLDIEVIAGDIQTDNQIAEIQTQLAADRAPLTIGSQVTDQLGVDGDGATPHAEDVDLHPLQVDANQRLSIATRPGLGPSTPTGLRVFDASGNELASAAPAVENQLNFNATAGTTYFVGVSGATTYDPVNGGGATSASLALHFG